MPTVKFPKKRSGGGGPTQLSTPTLTATVISSTQIDLSWTNVANESSYKLEWSANGTSGWTQIGGTIAANTTTYSHTSLTASTLYYYRVSAIGDGVTYSDSGYGTDNDTTSAGSSVDLSGYPGGLISTAPSGATAPGPAFSWTHNSNTATAGTPLISEYTTSDNTNTSASSTYVEFSGENLSGLTTGKVYDGSTLADYTAGTVYGQTGAILLPSSTFKARVFWAKNATGHGKAVMQNKSELYWTRTTAVANTTSYVYGRNLATGNVDGTGNSNIWISPNSNGSGGQWCSIGAVTPYSVAFTVPSGLTNGIYYVWAHHGSGGGDWAFSNSVSLTIVSASSHVLHKSFGSTVTVAAATGNATNDRSAINTAVASAGAGGTVQFGAGTYNVNGAIDVLSGQRWLGATLSSGNNTTIIRVTSTFSNAGEGLLNRSGTLDLNRFENITFETNGFTTDLSYSPTEPVFISLSSSTMQHFKHCTLDARYTEALRINSFNNLYIEDCLIIGGSYDYGNEVFLDGGSQVFIWGTTFKMTNDCTSSITAKAINGVHHYGNTIQDLDNSNINSGSGWGKGRIWASLGSAGSSRNMLFYNNYGNALGPRNGTGSTDLQNAGEIFLWEASEAEVKLTASSSTSNTIVFGTTVSRGEPFGVQIIAGKGKGQSRIVIGGDGTNTLTVNRDWLVNPDNTSVVHIGPVNENLIIYKNTLNAEGKDNLRTSANNVTNATAGCNFYGLCVKSIYDGNITSKMRTGFMSNPTQHSSDKTDCNMFIECLNNTESYHRWTNRLSMDHDPAFSSTPAYPMQLCILFDKNVHQNIVTQSISGTTYYPEFAIFAKDNGSFTYGAPPIQGLAISNTTLYQTIAMNNWWGQDNGQHPLYPIPGSVTGFIEGLSTYNNA